LRAEQPEAVFNFCAISAGASGSPFTSASKLRSSSATGLSAAGVYVKTMPWPTVPSSIVASISISGDSETVPLAV